MVFSIGTIFWIVLPGKRNLMSESDFHEFKKIKISQIVKQTI